MPEPEPEAFVWTRGAVKARLLELLEGDKTHANEAWVNGHGDEVHAWGPEVADELARLWKENQPADEAAAAPSLPLGEET